ncbi:hypothetical protein L249_6373 [Ophiocordyceps polyrhachis-furcata BCC 54312]|uniref:DNA-(apurinic or apyrimidinic site) lyase n=1 Tax=Ophiocordyceps polyrhachis-furcata BCC 54312 TaxID=1330021 RepID=A0A367LJP3_9HYPO|nr:hypothetical protein L249_6373 [Ophiocordyceps polyrhachis-furcata BCC 54312]
MSAAARRTPDWRKIPVSLSELCIDTTLRCGQAFRWRKLNDEWTSTLNGRILSLKQDAHYLHYKVTWPPSCLGKDDTENLLHRYFSLYLHLEALYAKWSAADHNFRQKAASLNGVRILSQDAWETLICFICSSNNNIGRISQMVYKLCKHYGPLIGHVGQEALHDFPTPKSLTGDQVESHLRELGFGYRAKYIAETARAIALTKPAMWLESLRNPAHQGLQDQLEPVAEHQKPTYRNAHTALLSLSGVGPKVADCVCLMGLGWGESVPVDTHVWQIAQRDYKFGKTKSKSFNKVLYNAVGDHFRDIWGEYAGWAHSVLFTADLKAFTDQDAAKLKHSSEASQAQVVDEEEAQAVGSRKRRAVKMEVKVEVSQAKATEITPKRRRTRQTQRKH